MQVLVTGGAGFIGSHLVRKLLEKGHSVRVMDNMLTGARENLAEVADHIEFIAGDIQDAGKTKIAVKGCEIIFHQAALPSVPRSVEDPISTVTNNVIGTTVLATEAVAAGVRRIIYAGSSSAYGNCEVARKAETILPAVLSPYAASKYAGESILQSYHYCYGIETIVARYFNVFGERQHAESPYSGVIAKFCRTMLEKRRPLIYGDGEQARDFTYVANVVDGNMKAAEADATVVAGQIYNIACGGSISLNELVGHLNTLLGEDLEPEYAQPRAGDIRQSCADISKAVKAIGYKPVVGFRAGLEKTLSWYRARVSET